ncbi:MAG: hypothetical protein M3Q30_09140 [Actinomycetota bacterium]|nr:hypothetical protein [Actinomycetota bacterium]
MQTLARLERGLEEQAHAQAVTDVTVQHLHSTVVDTGNDLIETVKRVFGRRRREAEVEARGALMQTLARLERGLEEQAHALAVTDVTVQHLHSTVGDTRHDLIESVKYLYEVCSLLIERTESAQLERQTLIETMTELARGSTVEPSRPGERVLGGSFTAYSEQSVDVDVGVEMEHRQSHWG